MNDRIGRGASFLIVTVIYILASVVGIVTYRLLPYPMWLSLLIADTAATVFTFIFSLIFRNASVYDPYWSVQPIVILAAFAVGQTLTLPRLLLLIAVCVWGVRLTANWAYTFHGLGHQDWRYTMLCEKTGVLYPIINFVGIHMVPTLVVYGCVLPGVVMLTGMRRLTQAALQDSCLPSEQRFCRAAPTARCTPSAKTEPVNSFAPDSGSIPVTPIILAR